MYRHGDVLILAPVQLPEQAKLRESGIVAEGEVTGHAHRLTNGSVYDSSGNLYVCAEEGAALTHEEHERLRLPKSDVGCAYPVILQREYDDEREWRQVAD